MTTYFKREKPMINLSGLFVVLGLFILSALVTCLTTWAFLKWLLQ